MIIIRLIGGLGNQLFQYAFGRSLAERWQCDLRFDATAFGQVDDRRRLSLHHFRAEAPLATNADLARVQCHSRSWLKDLVYRITNRNRDIQYYTESRVGYEEGGQNLSGSWYFHGYWQSEKYFSHLQDELRKDLMLREEVRGENREYLRTIENRCESVSLHVRRGDYVNNPKTRAVHDVCTLAYYGRSLAVIGDRVKAPHIFVFSDDIPWVRENLTIPFPVSYVESMDDRPDYVDLYLMSCCRHHIIANSSFSWWAAWLNGRSDKLVLAPDQWFRRGTLETPDIWPASWLRIDVGEYARAV